MTLKTEARLKEQIFNFYPQAMLIINNELSIIDANHAAAVYFSLEVKKLISTSLLKYFSPEAIGLISEFLAETRSQETADIMMNSTQQDGVKQQISVIKTHTDTAVVFVENLNMIGQQELGTTVGGIWSVMQRNVYKSQWQIELNSLMHVTYVSQELASTLGYSPEEMIGKTPFEFVPKFIRERVTIQIGEFINQKKHAFSLQVPHVASNREMKMLQLSGLPQYSEQNEFCGMKGMVSDVTASINSNLINQKIFDCAGIGMALVDLNDQYVNVNTALCEMVGYTKKELLSNQYHLVHPDDWRNTKLNIQLLLLEELHNSRMEKRLVTKDGKIIWISQNTTLLTNAFGTPWMLLMQMQDITESITIREQLREAKHRALESDKLKTALLYNINHEFRTPLNGMIGLSQLISETAQNVDVQEMATNITDCSKRLANVLESMILLSQLVSKCISVKNHMVNINQIVGKVVSRLMSQLNYKQIVCHVNVEPKIWIKSDSYLLEKALYQILDNSIKFSPFDSRISITALFEYSEFSNLACIQIIDQGSGISEDYIASLYTPFTQEDNGLNRSFEGLGIGLSIVKRIIDCLGGSIEVSSQKNEGTSVMLILHEAMIIDKNNAEQHVIGTEAPKTTLAPYSKTHKQVLLIEDNQISARLMIQFLAETFVVTHVSTGEAAVEKCSQNYYHLIITDIHLGNGITGIEASELIKAMKPYRNTPIIAVSGYFDSDKDPNFKRECFFGVMVKPFDAESLRLLIASALS